METKKFKMILAVGETIGVEFKRDGKVGDDTYKTICAFLNRFGGDVFLGVEDDKSISGIPTNEVPNIIRTINKTLNNPEIFSPSVYLVPEAFEYEDKTIIQIHVSPSSEVHSFKKVIYDRIDDMDVKVKATGTIAQLYIRKQNIFTEKKVFPFVKDSDLRFDLLPRVRQMAASNNPKHPWINMSDSEIIQSAGLISEDAETGKKGYNLAAVMLLGKDYLIQSISPIYRTDAILRKVNIDRYDDRLIVDTNLIESYDLLMGFAEKHLWDKFYLEGGIRMSLRNIISREIIVNTLMHRELSSSFIAKFVIEKDKMYIENANRTINAGIITPYNYQPTPKNPIIARFFRNIGYADELGSGVRNLFKYVRRYSGKNPQLIEDDIFKIIVPLDDNFSFDAQLGEMSESVGETIDQTSESVGEINSTQHSIIELITSNSNITIKEMSKITGVTTRSIERNIQQLRKKEIIDRFEGDFGGHWIIKSKIK
jgi:ATP-dependent DNA helicase RecG